MDITKCANEDCKKKEQCLRFMEPPNDFWQSYSYFECDPETTECRDFIEIKNYKNRKRMIIK